MPTYANQTAVTRKAVSLRGVNGRTYRAHDGHPIGHLSHDEIRQGEYGGIRHLGAILLADFEPFPDPDRVESVRLILYASHWWYLDGGFPHLGWIRRTQLPETLTEDNITPFLNDASKRSQRWRRHDWSQVDVTDETGFLDAVRAGECRVITAGPGPSHGSGAHVPDYYGAFGYKDPFAPSLVFDLRDES